MRVVHTIPTEQHPKHRQAMPLPTVPPSPYHPSCSAAAHVQASASAAVQYMLMAVLHREAKVLCTHNKLLLYPYNSHCGQLAGGRISSLERPYQLASRTYFGLPDTKPAAATTICC